MRYRETTTTREFVGRLDHGADWREEIESLARDEGVDAGWFTALGAVQDADVAYYDQDDFEYTTASFDEPLEVAACVGNVSVLDGDHFAHTHAVLSRRSGQALAGHLDAATVWAGEVYLRELDADLDRSPDPATDLDLWL
ncbi:PPC domain-containing DNA-binding protein [Halocalculus aciditolerans]|uniref:DNA-binding protein n=1 Tax=Halocalculus aciditolerans TaxID=1383812 RepID=A0A830F7H4_9EURY|nr:PPC domain-containing DNA-binding protein [Halocalculus aciditolerans]GGL47209.1 DNA-binding protein [Halocalculus aciditolerans]